MPHLKFPDSSALSVARGIFNLQPSTFGSLIFKAGLEGLPRVGYKW
jgi:hypothetical protein